MPTVVRFGRTHQRQVEPQRSSWNTNMCIPAPGKTMAVATPRSITSSQLGNGESSSCEPARYVRSAMGCVQAEIRRHLERRCRFARALRLAERFSQTPSSAALSSVVVSASNIFGRPDYFAAGGRSLWSIRDCSALRNASSVSIVFVNPAWRSLMVLTKARGPSGAP
jgi:hypothetical protein